MQSRLLKSDGERVFAVVLDPGEEAVDCLTRFAREQRISAASFTAIGAFRDVELGYFMWDRKDYKRIRIDEQVEVLALVGNIALKDDEPKLHPHIVVGKSDGTAHGGHLMQGHVRPTLEVVVEETPAHLHRVFDEQTGLALLRVR